MKHLSHVSRFISIPVIFFVAAVSARLLMVNLSHNPGHADPAFYLQVAKNLLAGKGFTIDYIWHYLPPPGTITHPSNGYWMPLVSIIIAVFMKVFGQSYFIAILPSILFGIGIAVTTYFLAVLYTRSRYTGLFSAVIVLCIPRLFWSSLLSDTFIYYTFFASACLFLLVKAWKKPVFYLPAALLAGLAHLTRNDGILLFFTLLLTLFCSNLTIKEKFRWAVLSAISYTAILLPLFIGNYMTFGAIMPPVYKTMFLMDYEDLYAYGTDLSLHSYLSHGLKNILSAKLAAIPVYLTQILEYFGPVILLLSAMGIIRAVRSKRIFHDKRIFLPHVIFFTFLVIFYTFVGTAVGKEGGFIKSSLAVVPFLIVLSVDVIRSISRSEMTATFILTLLAVFLFYKSLAFTADDILNREAQGRVMERIAKVLKQEQIKDPYHEIVMMTRYPWQFNYLTGFKAVMVPNNDLDTIYEVAKKYNANYILLPIPERECLMDILNGNTADPRFVFTRYAFLLERVKIYRIKI